MSTVQQQQIIQQFQTIQQQNAQFRAARDSGQITESQYQQAMSFQNSKTSSLVVSARQAGVNLEPYNIYPTQQTQKPVSPLPSESAFTDHYIQQNGTLWVQQGYVATPVTIQDPNTGKPTQAMTITPTPEQAFKESSAAYLKQPLIDKINPFSPNNALAYLSNSNQQLTAITVARGGQANPIYEGVAGLGGSVANDLVGIGNVPKVLAGKQPTPAPYVAKSEAERVGGYVAKGIEIGVVAAATGGTGLVAGAINVGVSEALNFAPAIPVLNPNPTGKLNLNPTDIANDFLLGQVTYGVGKVVTPVVSRGLQTVARADIPVLSKTVQLGEAAGQKLSTQVSRVTNEMPIVKIGNVDVPYTGKVGGEIMQGEANWKGLYVVKGANAKPVIGRLTNLPEGEGFRVSQLATEVGNGAVSPTTQEVASGVMRYRPQSPIEGAVTRDVMRATGVPESVLNVNKQAINVVSTLKAGVKEPKLFTESTPLMTKTSNELEVGALKQYIIKNKDVVDRVFGKYAATPQENPRFLNEALTSEGDVVSSARVTSDIDIQLKPGISQERAIDFAKGVKELYSPEAGASLKEGSTLVETIPVELRGTPNAKLAHAVDIHSDYDALLNPNTGQSAKGMTWGIKIGEKPTTIDGIPVSRLTEQVGGKMQSIMDINESNRFGPVPHRTKDIPDFFTDASTLNEQLRTPQIKVFGKTLYKATGKQEKVASELQNIADYYNLGKVPKAGVVTEEYVLERTIPEPRLPSSVGRTVSQGSASIISRQPITMPSIGSTQIGSQKAVVSEYSSQKGSNLSSLSYFSGSNPIVIKGSQYNYEPSSAGKSVASPSVSIIEPSPYSPAKYTQTNNVPSPIPTPNYKPSPYTPSPPSPSIPNPFPEPYPSPPPYIKEGSSKGKSTKLINPYGSTGMERGTNAFWGTKPSGLMSGKRQYNIMTAEQFLGNTKSSKRSKSIW